VSRWSRVAAIALVGCGFSAPGNTPADADTAGSDTGIGGAVCGGAIESEDLISRWQFSRDSREVDDLGVAAAEANGQINTVNGPTACGDAIGFGDGQPSFLLINDRLEWDAIRSLDFFARYPVTATDAGLLSRDSNGSNNGNLGVYLTRDSANTTTLIALRVQRSGGGTVFRCAPAPAPDTWFHIGVNFGGDDGGDQIELWIDGSEGVATDTINLLGNNVCGSGADRHTLEGSADPWTVGISSEASDFGNSNNLSRPFGLGAIDNLRFANQRRDFSAN
jgi:hypothetical protein